MREEEWEEIDPKKKEWRRDRAPYITLRVKSGKIYFSFRMIKDYFGECEKVIVRYHQGLNVISFMPGNNGAKSYKLSGKGGKSISAKNVFRRVGIRNKKNMKYYVKYDKATKWLIVELNEKQEGRVKCLKA